MDSSGGALYFGAVEVTLIIKEEIVIKKYIFLVVIFVLSSGFRTNEVSTDDMVEEIHRLVNTEENMTRALEQIFLSKLNLQDDTKVKKVKEEISNLVSDVMADDAYFNDFKELYLNVFTEKEIAQLLDFFINQKSVRRC